MFNRFFDGVSGRYAPLLRRIVTRRIVTFAMLGGFAFGIVTVASRLPAGFVPNEDQGMIYAIIQTPPGSTLEQTNDVARRVQEIVKDIEGIQSVSSLAGYEVLTEGRGSNAGTCLINLKNWSERKRSVQQIVEELRAQDQGHRRDHRVLRAAGGARLRCRQRLRAAAHRQDQLDRLPKSSIASTRPSWMSFASAKS